MTTLTAACTRGRMALDDLDRRHVIHPHQNRLRTNRHVFVRGSGSVVWDTDNVAHLDMVSGGNWVVAVGHGRQELADIAARQAAQLGYFSCWREYSNEPAVRLAQRLAALAPPGMSKVHLTSGGSDGTETAIKVARRYHFERGDTERTWILGRHFGYHGTSIAGAAVSGMDDMHYGVGPTMPHVAKLSAPFTYRTEEYGGQDPTDYLIDELEAKIQEIGSHRIAALIGEPVMGGGGVLVPPADYWSRVREVLTRHGILLIADEVITAYGRTGAWFASASYSPDIIVSAKGLTSGYAPLGAVIMRDDIGETMVNGDMMFFHGQTYSGHPVACALALENLDILDREGLLGNAPRIEEWFRDGLAPLTELDIVGEVRQHGAMVGIELVQDPVMRTPFDFNQSVDVVDRLRHRHQVLVRDYGPTIVIGPPLVLRHEQAARTSHAVWDVLTEISTEIAARRQL